MDAPQLHIAINHFPVILSVTGALVLLYGLYRKNFSVRNTGLVIVLAAALITLPTYFLGQAAEDIVESFPGVTHDHIENHEKSATVSLALLLIAGFIAAWALLVRKSVLRGKNLAIAAFVITLIAFGSSAWTAHLGGQIRHPELRKGFVAGESKDDSEKLQKDQEKALKEKEKDAEKKAKEY